jgi:hypothetical protein
MQPEPHSTREATLFGLEPRRAGLLIKFLCCAVVSAMVGLCALVLVDMIRSISIWDWRNTFSIGFFALVSLFILSMLAWAIRLPSSHYTREARILRRVGYRTLSRTAAQEQTRLMQLEESIDREVQERLQDKRKVAKKRPIRGDASQENPAK